MSRYGSRKGFDLEWIERWARCVNEDRILPVIGKFFTNRFVLGVDEQPHADSQVPGTSQMLSVMFAPLMIGERAQYSVWRRAEADLYRVAVAHQTGNVTGHDV